MGSCKVILLLGFLISCSFHFLNVISAEFDIGGDKNWVVPSSENDQLYNKWASENRFKVGDTLRFEYKKDSVLVVTNEEYDKCISAHPTFFSNNGDTVFKFDKPGLFYFISGVVGHCERGQKMIVKVLEPESPPPPPSSNETGGGAVVEVGGTISLSCCGAHDHVVPCGTSLHVFGAIVFVGFFGCLFILFLKL